MTCREDESEGARAEKACEFRRIMEIIRMQSSGIKTTLILVACGWGLWRMADRWLGPAVRSGEVTILTTDNFGEVRRTAKTLLALYMHPG